MQTLRHQLYTRGRIGRRLISVTPIIALALLLGGLFLFYPGGETAVFAAQNEGATVSVIQPADIDQNSAPAGEGEEEKDTPPVSFPPQFTTIVFVVLSVVAGLIIYFWPRKPATRAHQDHR